MERESFGATRERTERAKERERKEQSELRSVGRGKVNEKSRFRRMRQERGMSNKDDGDRTKRPGEGRD